MILSVSIITQEGRPIVARQYNRFSRSQLEGHLAAFPKLISNSSQSYIETENIRYVFQTLGKLYFVLITSKDSNIIEDLDVLSMLVSITCDQLGVADSQVDESDIYVSSFQLIFAYDECIFDGYYQNVTVDEVNTFLDMESKEENEYLERRRDQEEAAKATMAKKMKELEQQRKLAAKAAAAAGNTKPQFQYLLQVNHLLYLEYISLQMALLHLFLHI